LIRIKRGGTSSLRLFDIRSIFETKKSNLELVRLGNSNIVCKNVLPEQKKSKTFPEA